MEENKIKKKKLTLSVSSKKPYNTSNFRQSKGKTSVVIEKKPSRSWNEKRFHSRDSGLNKPKSRFTDKTNVKPDRNFDLKTTTAKRNFEIRKIAEERATKRFKNIKEEKDNLQQKKAIC